MYFVSFNVTVNLTLRDKFFNDTARILTIGEGHNERCSKLPQDVELSKWLFGHYDMQPKLWSDVMADWQNHQTSASVNTADDRNFVAVLHPTPSRFFFVITRWEDADYGIVAVSVISFSAHLLQIHNTNGTLPRLALKGIFRLMV